MQISKKSIIIFIFMLAAVAAVSGCGTKESGIMNQESGISNNESGIIDQTDNRSESGQAIATTTEEIASTSDSIFASSTSNIDTSDWLTYRNEEYGFEVKYPKEWKIFSDRKVNNNDFIVFVSTTTEQNIIDAKKRNIVEIPSGDIVIKIYESNNFDLLNFINNEKQNFEIMSYKETKINNNIAYNVVSGGYGQNFSVFLKNKEMIIRFYFDLKPEEKDLNQIEKQIISNIVLF